MNFADLFHHETNLQELSAGQPLFREGDDLNGLMYVLMSGSAEIMVGGRVMETAKTGAILGEMAMVDEGVRSASVIATTDCKLFAVDRDRFNFLVQQTPNFAQNVMRVIANRLRKADGVL